MTAATDAARFLIGEPQQRVWSSLFPHRGAVAVTRRAVPTRAHYHPGRPGVKDARRISHSGDEPR